MFGTVSIASALRRCKQYFTIFTIALIAAPLAEIIAITALLLMTGADR